MKASHPPTGRAAAHAALGLWLALAPAGCAVERRAPALPASPAPRRELPAPAGSGRADGGEPDAGARGPGVPRGCEVNLAGRYHLWGRPSVRYLATDDGEQLMVRALGPDSADGGEAEGMTLVLDRKPEGFVGLLVGSARLDGGAPCPVAFPAALTACGAEGLVVRSIDEVRIDARCTLSEGGQAPSDKRLVRE